MVTAATPAKTGPLTYKRITPTVAPSASAQPEPPNATHTPASSGRRFKAWQTGKWEPSRSTLEPSPGLPTISIQKTFLEKRSLICHEVKLMTYVSVRRLIVCSVFIKYQNGFLECLWVHWHRPQTPPRTSLSQPWFDLVPDHGWLRKRHSKISIS